MYSRVRHTKNVDLCHASGTQSVIQIVAGLQQEHRLGIHVSRVCTVLGRQGYTDSTGLEETAFWCGHFSFLSLPPTVYSAQLWEEG